MASATTPAIPVPPDGVQRARLVVQPAPHVHAGEYVDGLMYRTLLALAVPVAAAVGTHGWPAVRLVVATVVAALAADALSEAARHRPAVHALRGASAAVTGVLLALTLPPTLPTGMAVLGAVVAIVLGKHVFGGLGYNLFNPALVGHVFLLASFGPQFTNGATPALLELARRGQVVPDYLPMLWNGGSGPLAAAVPLAVLAGGIVLLGWNTTRWQATAGFWVGSAVLAWATGWNPVFHWLAGLGPLTAFFFVNDPVTTPAGKEGRWLFGIGAGALMVLLRTHSGYVEGAAFAVLMMNALAPLLNRLSVAVRRRRWEANRLKAASTVSWGKDLQAVLVLVLVTALSGVLLATFYHATAPLIASQQQRREVEVGLKGVIPEAARFEVAAEVDGTPIYEALGPDGQRLGVALFVEGEGYGGTIRAAVGLDPAGGTLTGVRILKQSETPGLGARVAEPEFLKQFTGKALDDPYIPGDDVETVSGATISSTAVTEIVYQAIETVQKAREAGELQ